MIIEESDIALVAAGNMLITALAVRDKLKEKGYNITVVNERFIKPVDTDMLDRLSESHRLIVTMEEMFCQVALVKRSVNIMMIHVMI